MRRGGASIATAVLALVGLTACTSGPSSEVPSDWSQVEFPGGSLSVPPGTTADPAPPRPAALLSRGLTTEGRATGRLDVYSESPPGADASPAAPDDVACPGGGASTSEEFRPGEAVVNVFDSRVTGDGAEQEGDRVVCATWSGQQDEPSLQVVLQGADDALPESVWRPLVESVRPGSSG